MNFTLLFNFGDLIISNFPLPYGNESLFFNVDDLIISNFPQPVDNEWARYVIPTFQTVDFPVLPSINDYARMP